VEWGYDGLPVLPEAKVLAESEFLPPKSEPGAKPKAVPQVWALEQAGYRAFTSIPGLRLTTFSVPAYRALLLRGIAWAGRREQIAESLHAGRNGGAAGAGNGTLKRGRLLGRATTFTWRGGGGGDRREQGGAEQEREGTAVSWRGATKNPDTEVSGFRD